MLEVVRDGYKTLLLKTQLAETKAAELYSTQITETKVMHSTISSEIVNKQKMIEEFNITLPQTQADLEASQTDLSDAEQNHENLKKPCLNSDDAAKRKQQIESEIAALQEAEKMLEAYAGSSLLQEVSSANHGQAIQQVPAGNAQLKRVVELLQGVKSDVQKDLDSDTAAHSDMRAWCGTTISETEAAIVVQRDRDSELVTAIEVSTQQKTVLATQLAKLSEEMAKETESLNQMGQLRSNDMESFKNAEKETMIAIASLRNAIIVLKSRYEAFDKKDKRSFESEQAAFDEATSEGDASDRANAKTQPLSFTHVADSVARALKFLPASEFNSALSGESGAILQAFLSRPEAIAVPFTKHAGLTQTSTEVVSDPSGRTILGILESLLETFTSDLQAMQEKEGQGIGTYTSTKKAKETQVAALQSSISTKEAQLAHYTTMHAQAKEDLAYLRDASNLDVRYLRQVREQCLASESEFEVRKKAREQELKALNEGISILTAGAGAEAAGRANDAVATAPQNTPNLLIHSAKHVQRVFKRQEDSGRKRVVLRVAPSTSAGPLANMSSGAARVHMNALPAHAVQRTIPVLGKSGAVRTPVGRAAVHMTTAQPQSGIEKKNTAGSTSSLSSLGVALSNPHPSLAALKSQIQLVQHKVSVGPLTVDAIKAVTAQVDTVVAQLQKQKQLEIKKKDTCISEKNDAVQQQEQHATEKSKLETEITALNASIQSMTKDLAAIADSIEEVNSSMIEAARTREEESNAYQASVQEQLDQQKALNEAIAILKDFYVRSPAKKVSTLQASPDSRPPMKLDPVLNLAHTSHTAQPNLPKVDVEVSGNYSSLHSVGSPMESANHVKLNSNHRADPAEDASASASSALDDAVEKNMDTKWGDVKNVKANRTDAPKGFEKPLEAHSGGRGIIGILEIILEESVALIGQSVKDEKAAFDLHLANMNQNMQMLTQKHKESTMLEQAKNDNELKMTQDEQSLKAVETEVMEIDAYELTLDKHCKFFLENFEANQEARTLEISNTKKAKEVLLGMELDSVP
jgi:hypothetical protein